MWGIVEGIGVILFGDGKIYERYVVFLSIWRLLSGRGFNLVLNDFEGRIRINR